MKSLLEIVKDYEKLSKEEKVIQPFIQNNFELEKILSDINKNSHLIFSIIFFDDEFIDGKIEMLPLELKKEFKKISLQDLANYDFEKYRKFFDKFLKEISDLKIKNFIKMMKKINDESNSNMSNFWKNDISSKELKNKLIKISGLDEEKINLFLIILVNKYYVKLSDYSAINITNDAYIKSAMCAIGMINHNASYEEMVKTCMRINPDFPGLFDSFLWMIGKYIINENNDNKLLDKCIFAYNKYKK